MILHDARPDTAAHLLRLADRKLYTQQQSDAQRDLQDARTEIANVLRSLPRRHRHKDTTP